MPDIDTIFDDSENDFDQIHASFAWDIPGNFNLAEAVCGRHKGISKQVALFCENDRGESARYTFGDLEKLSNRLANVLISLGLKRGDRVAILLPQRVKLGSPILRRGKRAHCRYRSPFYLDQKRSVIDWRIVVPVL